jgi:hypothetical protein
MRSHLPKAILANRIASVMQGIPRSARVLFVSAAFALVFAAFTNSIAAGLNFEVSFLERNPRGDGTSSVIKRAFNTVTGPADGKRLLTGMRLVPSGTDGIYIGIDRSTVLRVNANGETVNESQSKQELADWAMGVAYDSQEHHVILVTLGGEGFLYQRTVSGEWSTLASMNNIDLESLVYRPEDNALYGIQVYNGAPSAPATLMKYSPTGQRLVEIALPAFPIDLGPGGNTAKLVAVEGKIVALVDPDLQQLLDASDHSRIYVIDPATGSAELTYDHAASNTGNVPNVYFTSPTNFSFTLGQTITLTIIASDVDNDLSSVELLDGTTLLRRWTYDQPTGSQTLHLTFDWTPTNMGEHALALRSRDAKGNQREDGLRITIVERPESFIAWYFKTREIVGIDYTRDGPNDGGTLFRGLFVAQAGYRYLGRDGHTIFRWDNERDVYTETSPGGDFSWPRGTAFDSKRNRFLVVSLVGDGTLYAVQPATLEWSTLASMDNIDVDSIEYNLGDDRIYMVENHGGTVKILRYTPEGAPAGSVSIPDVPLEVGSYYSSRLISNGEKLALLIEPTPGWNPKLPAESRIYVIDPVTNTFQLTYRKQWQTWPPNTPPKLGLRITSPLEGAQYPRGVPIHLTAQVENGAVSSVQFRANGTLIGNGTNSSAGSSPQTFGFTWNNAPTGDVTLRADSVTATGTTISSDPLHIQVLQATNWPVVRILSPTTTDVIHLGDTVRVKFEVFDADNNLRQITFQGQPFLSFDPPPVGTNTYIAEYVPTRTGSLSLTAAAYDGVGLKNAASVLINVLEAPRPTISITSPTNLMQFAQGNAVPINTRGNVGFANVSIFADGQKLGEAKEALITVYPPYYGLTWSNAPTGEHTLLAVGTTARNTSATSAPVRIRVVATTPVATITRDLPDNYAAGAWLDVKLIAKLNSAVSAWALEELLPDGWTFGQASHQGVFDKVTGRIKWGPFTDGVLEKTIIYTIQPATNSTGPKKFSGVVSVNGSAQPVVGDSLITDAPTYHPADVPAQDKRLTVNEVTAYASAWKTGTAWPRGPSQIPISYVTRAGQIWKSGEQYDFNPAMPAPSCWVPITQKPPTNGIIAFAIAANSATRYLPPAFTPGRVTTVSLNVRPAAGIQNYAVEEFPPAGWTIVDAEGATASGGTLRYGPFYDTQERTFVYHLIPAGNAARQFTGQASFDGSKDEIAGPSSAKPPSTLAESHDGHIYLHFNGTPGELFIMESADTIDSATWQFEATIQGADDAIDMPPIAPAGTQKFYRLRPASP